MAGNRFTNQYYNYTPSGYLGKPLDYTPDLTGLSEIAAQYQDIWDSRANLAIPTPKYIPTEQEKKLVQEQYIDPFTQRQEGVIDLLTTDTRKGLSELRNFEKDLIASQKTGKYKQFEDNYTAYETYKKELDTAVKDEKILSTERDASLANSINQFGSSYNEDDVANNFKGESWAALQDYTEIALDYADDWKANSFPLGVKEVKGGYYDFQTKKVVTKEEVLSPIVSALYNNKEVVAAAVYRGKLEGNSGEELEAYVKKTLGTAAAVAAEKESSVNFTRNIKKDWQQAQRNQFKQDYDLINYDYGVGAGTSELEVQNPNKLGSLETSKVTGGLHIVGAEYIGGGGVMTKNNKYGRSEPSSWDKLIKNEKFAKDNPAVVKLVDELPRNIGESDKEYNTRFKSSWDNIKKKINTTTLQFDNYGEKLSKSSTAQVIGNGYIDRQTLYVIDAKGKTTPMSYAQMLDSHNMNITDEDFKKKAKINGQTKFTNGLAPTGYVGTITVGEGKDAATYNFIVPDNMEHNRTMKDIYKATSILSDYTQDVSEPFNVFGKTLKVRKKRVYARDNKGGVTDYEEYPVIVDSEDKLLYKPELNAEQTDKQLLELNNRLLQSIGNGDITEEQASNQYFKALQSVTIDMEDIRQMQSRNSTFNPLNFNQYGQVRNPKQDPKFTQLPLNK